jgi:endo-1,4-beta-xylanase
MQHADSKEEEMHVEKCLGRYVVLLLTVLAFIARPLFGQQPVVTLWPHGAPGSEGKTAQEKVRITPQGEHIVSSVHRPSITVYLPAAGKATGVGVLVIPGGGHSEIWIDHEGYSVAAWLSEHGVAAFVLKYRLAREAGSTYTVDGTELQDAQRAMRLIRSRASEWSVDPQRLGVIGFSAGGELAALVGTRYEAGLPGSADPIDRESSRPAFQGLIYPSIPQRMNLSKDMPPAFLACGANDRPVLGGTSRTVPDDETRRHGCRTPCFFGTGTRVWGPGHESQQCHRLARLVLSLAGELRICE